MVVNIVNPLLSLSLTRIHVEVDIKKGFTTVNPSLETAGADI